ncbi:MAG: hypothetical protein JF616_17620 [Fibrobacteres bacterium]|nr:hypothetical protein [Fibrobacterota bacterium]
MSRPSFFLENRIFSLKSTCNGAVVALALSLLSGCEEEKPRVYSEVAFKPIAAAGPMGGMGMPGGAGMPAMAAPPADIKVTWTLPKGWVPKDSANAMRVGSFAAMDPNLANSGEIDPNAVDVSVVQLGGTAGGLEANIRRWMGQVGLKASPEEMEGIIKKAPRFKTATGQEGMLIDLTGMLSGDMTQSKTIYGAIVQTEEYTVFVKAMGDFAQVKKQKPQVAAFCKSLRIAGTKA